MWGSQRYGIIVSYELGKNSSLADLISRAYLSKDVEHEGEEFESVNMASYVPISYQRHEEIRQETQKNKSLSVLNEVILQGWPVFLPRICHESSSIPPLASVTVSVMARWKQPSKKRINFYEIV